MFPFLYDITVYRGRQKAKHVITRQVIGALLQLLLTGLRELSPRRCHINSLLNQWRIRGKSETQWLFLLTDTLVQIQASATLNSHKDVLQESLFPLCLLLHLYLESYTPNGIILITFVKSDSKFTHSKNGTLTKKNREIQIDNTFFFYIRNLIIG